MTSPTLPAILAIAERDGLSGRDVTALEPSIDAETRTKSLHHRLDGGAHSQLLEETRMQLINDAAQTRERSHNRCVGPGG